VWTEPLAELHANAIGRDGAHVIVLQPDHGREDLFAPFDRLLGGVSHTRNARVAADAARVVAELNLADSLSRMAVDGLVLTILAASSRTFEARTHHARPPRWLLQAKDLLHARFRDRLELADVAAAAGVRPARLAQAFRRHFRCSPGDYVRGLRIRWAAERLATTDTAISRIAISAGFSDQSHLTREFGRRMGVTPGVYRRGSARALPTAALPRSAHDSVSRR
jgi:AraC family transcriptional regulator